ncbi:hypothetical protein KUTeg_016656 [Tegillarca granosa]|uniref:Laminin EGF-like domain-containing protein n=1 Tax=Tegillarca granosa TaxID=220873 RepID=A0ABQ9ELJ2_TEGGR|nr:hypothetical protein KUTeg_016656 [Tegillarca granosa]
MTSCECQCAEPGSVDQICREDGQCPCRSNYGSRTCGHCSPGYYSYPDCKPCNCELYGSYGLSCEQVTGQCDCRPTFQGVMCDSCKEGFYNYPICEVCNCNPSGAKEIPGYPLGGCGMVVTGQLCECKERVTGRICDRCKPGYYGLNRNNPLGCDACMCYTPGTVSGLNVCDQENGQCICKVDVTGQNCDTCIDGFYGLTENNPFGCVECDCDMGGSVSPVCDKRTGQCRCKPRVQGRRCERPESLHFYPTLHQFVYEIEDGYTPEGTPVRYGFDQTVFPDFSWRGYAVLTQVQPEVIMDININKPSLYRLIYRYHNLNDETVRGEVVLKPRSDRQDTQRSEVFFSATNSPDFATVGSSTSMYDFDYMVLIPQAYYEATVLQQRVTRPLIYMCLQYNYPDITEFPVTFGQDGFIIDVDGNRTRTQVFTDKVILDELGIPALAQLNENQVMLKNHSLDVPVMTRVPNPGLYTLVFNYYTFSDKTKNLDVNVRTLNGDMDGKVLVTNCDYSYARGLSVLCRQVMKGSDDMPSVVNITDSAELTITGPYDINVAIGSVVAIPYSDCIASRYSVPVGTTKIEFEDPPNEGLRVDLDNLPPRILDKSTGLVRLNSTVV